VWAGLVSCTQEMRTTLRVRFLSEIGLQKISDHWEMEIKYPRRLREEDFEYVVIIYVAQDKVSWDATQTAVNVQVSQKQGIS